jgi:hypothetical protein
MKTVGRVYYSEKTIEVYKKIGFTFDSFLKDRDPIPYFINNEPTIEINTIDELIKLTELVGCLIFDGDTIEINDNYSN